MIRPFIFCVWDGREQDHSLNIFSQTVKTARHDGPFNNNRRDRLRLRYRTTTTVYFMLGSKKRSVLPIWKYVPPGVIV